MRARCRARLTRCCTWWPQTCATSKTCSSESVPRVRRPHQERAGAVAPVAARDGLGGHLGLRLPGRGTGGPAALVRRGRRGRQSLFASLCSAAHSQQSSSVVNVRQLCCEYAAEQLCCEYAAEQLCCEYAPEQRKRGSNCLGAVSATNRRYEPSRRNESLVRRTCCALASTTNQAMLEAASTGAFRPRCAIARRPNR